MRFIMLVIFDTGVVIFLYVLSIIYILTPAHLPHQVLSPPTPKNDCSLMCASAIAVMISPLAYVIMSIFLTIFYILLSIATDGSTRHINCICVLMTFLLCTIVSIMFLTAVGGAIDIANGSRNF